MTAESADAPALVLLVQVAKKYISVLKCALITKTVNIAIVSRESPAPAVKKSFSPLSRFPALLLLVVIDVSVYCCCNALSPS